MDHQVEMGDGALVVRPEAALSAAQAFEFMPAAGPHARPELTNYDACPGSGVLPSETFAQEESDPGAG